MPILGLTTVETDANWRFKNIRRRVFYQYPNGKMPLVGLLSLMGEEPTNDPEFKWFEKRYRQRRTTLYRADNIGPWTNLTNNGNPTTLVAGTEYGLRVARLTASTSDYPFKLGDVLQIHTITNAGTTTVLGRITGLITTDQTAYVNYKVMYVCQANGSTADITLGTQTAASGVSVPAIGTSFVEGASVATGQEAELYSLPIEPRNYTQIFRTPFTLTGTAMATAIRYDESGPYKDKAKEAALNHMADLERAFIFGAARSTTVSGLPMRYTGGILYFLRAWELGNNATSVAGMPVYQSEDVSSATYTNDLKRIIDLSGVAITERIYDMLLERVFRVTNNTTNEKLVLCGNQALNVINQLYKTKSCLTADLPLKDTYGMNVVKHVTPFGTLYYKTHPLFNEDPTLRGSMLIVDVNNLKYRYLQGRDTTLLKNRQNPGDDFRRDEWLSECGLEVRFPESHMYIMNLTDYSV